MKYITMDGKIIVEEREDGYVCGPHSGWPSLKAAESYLGRLRPLASDKHSALESVKAAVDRPQHYNGTECIETMERVFGREAVIAFCELSAFKYQWRGGKKEGEAITKDQAKAVWYLNYAMELRNGQK